jgi:hypothetical protein
MANEYSDIIGNLAVTTNLNVLGGNHFLGVSPTETMTEKGRTRSQTDLNNVEKLEHSVSKSNNEWANFRIQILTNQTTTIREKIDEVKRENNPSKMTTKPCAIS